MSTKTVSFPVMASEEECRAALDRLASQLGTVDPETRSRHVLNRSLSCELTDLGVTFLGLLDGDGLHDITTGSSKGAQVKLRMTSDDLMALTTGELSFAKAWATGKLRVDASLTDLLRLRTML